MELRQIIRNQKLQNFSLVSLVKEASDYEEFISQKISGLGGKKVTIGTALSYASHDDFKARQDKVKIYNDALSTIQSGVESGELESKNIPQDVKDAGVKRKSPEPEKEPSAKPDEDKTGEEDFDDELADLQDFMAAEPMPGEEDDDDKADKSSDTDKKTDINSEEVVKKADEIEKRENDLTSKQVEVEEDKKEFLSNMVDAMLKETSVPTGAGKYNMSREDFEVYRKFIDGPKPEVPSIDVPDEELDEVFDNIKERLGSKGYAAFVNKAKGAGAPPPEIKTDLARARAVVRSYISTAGISVVSGERIPFYDTQLDHVVSLANGGVDGGDNWQWMEARYNQFKLEFTDDVLMDKIEAGLAKSPDEDKLKLLQTEYKNYARNSMVDFFKKSGYSSLTKEDVLKAKGEAGVQLVKAIAETSGISRYQNVPGGDGGGTRTRGAALPLSVLKKKIVKELKLQPKSVKTAVDKEFSVIIDELAKQQGEIGKVKGAIKQQKAAKKESIKYFGDILNELKQNTLGHHWMKAEEDYPVHYFIREINEGSLN